MRIRQFATFVWQNYSCMRQTYQVVYAQYASLEALPPEDQQLVAAARGALSLAYTPYSGFCVGAAARLSNGAIVCGANFENAAYPMCLCAERSTLAAAISRHPDACVTDIAVAAATKGQLTNTPATPCGACRQVLYEAEQKFGRPIRLILQGKDHSLLVFERASDLLPLAFGSEALGSI